MDPVSIAAGALGIAHICVSLSQKLAQTYDGIKSTDVQALHEEIDTYERTFTELETMFHHAPSPLPIQQRSWKNIMAVINDSRKNLYQLIKTIPSKPVGDSTKLSDQIKTWARTTTVSTIRSRMSSYCKMLNCQMTTMVLVEQWRSQASQIEVHQLLHDINHKLDQVINQPYIVETPQEPSQLENVFAERNRLEWVDSVNLITAACTTDYDPSVHSTVNEQSQTRGGLAQWLNDGNSSRYSLESPSLDMLSQEDDEIESDADSIIPEEGLTGNHERSHQTLIEHLEGAVERYLAANLLSKAETDLKRAMEEHEKHTELYSVPYRNKNTLRLKLASIYHRQGTKQSLDNAKAIVRDLIKSEQGHTEQKWTYYHFLASVYLEQGKFEAATGRSKTANVRYNEAKKCAITALEGREMTFERGSRQCISTLELLINIVKQSGDVIAAEAYRKQLELDAEVYKEKDVHSSGSGSDSRSSESFTEIEAIIEPPVQHVASREQRVLQWLTQNGFESDNPDYRNLLDNEQRPPLVRAVQLGEKPDMIEGLVRAGVDVNATDSTGDCALFLAADNDNAELVGILLDNECQPDLVDKDGKTALHRAITSTSSHLTVQRLLEQEPSLLNWQSRREEKSPLHFAAELGNAEVTKFLINQKADLNISDRVGRTPLKTAIESARAAGGREEVVKAFLEGDRRSEVTITPELISQAHSSTRGLRAIFHDITTQPGVPSSSSRNTSPTTPSSIDSSRRRTSNATIASSNSFYTRPSGLLSFRRNASVV